jgi:uncharacterized tellurite resistance protein B-like protein
MNITVLDKSSYLKGLLILAKRDKVLAESEEEIIRNVAHRLGFSSDFYEETLKGLLSNEYLTEDPVKFSEERISHSFIIDGLKLAHSDGNPDDREINWLRETAKENKISPEWFEKVLQEMNSKPLGLLNNDFELYSLIK